MSTVATTTSNTQHAGAGGSSEPLLLKPEQAAHLLGVSIDGVKYLHRMGRLRGIVLMHKLRFRRQTVERFVQELELEQET